jgi:hypothetical protein
MEGGWPIGDSEAGVVAGDQSAGDDKDKGAEGDTSREAMVRFVVRCGQRVQVTTPET